MSVMSSINHGVRKVVATAGCRTAPSTAVKGSFAGQPARVAEEQKIGLVVCAWLVAATLWRLVTRVLVVGYASVRSTPITGLALHVGVVFC
jgi:hypothetical protein